MNRDRKNSGRVENVERTPDVAPKPYRSPAMVRYGTLHELTLQGKLNQSNEQGSNVP